MKLDIVLSLVTRVMMIATGLIASILTARTLGVAGRGEYFYIVTLASLAAQFGNLGLASSNTYSLAKDHSLLPRLAANSFWISLVAGTLAACFILVFEADQTNVAWFGGRPVWIVILMVPTMIYGLLVSNLLIGLSLFRQYNVFQLGSGIFHTAAVALAAWMVGGVEGFLVVSAVAGLVAAFGLTVILSRLHKLTWRFDWHLLRSNIGYSGRAYLATLMAYGVSRVGVLLLDHFAERTEIGIYSIAVQFADVLIVVPSTVAMVLFPDLLKGPAEKRFVRTMRTTAQVALIMAALCVVTGLIAILIVPTLFGEAFAPAVMVLWWMLPGVFALSLANIISQYLAAQGIPLTNVWAWLGGLIVLLTTGSYFIPQWGAVGAAACLSLTYTFMAVVLSMLAFKYSSLETQMSA